LYLDTERMFILLGFVVSFRAWAVQEDLLNLWKQNYVR